MVETPQAVVPMKVYVRIFRSSVEFVITDFHTLRTRMMQLHSPVTKNLTTYLTCLPGPLPSHLSSRTIHVETP
jgi:hypothetical protein